MTACCFKQHAVKASKNPQTIKMQINMSQEFPPFKNLPLWGRGTALAVDEV